MNSVGDINRPVSILITNLHWWYHFPLKSRKKSSVPSTSKSSKHKSPVDVGLQDSPAFSSSEPGSSTTEQEVSFAAVSSNMTIKGSNALM